MAQTLGERIKEYRTSKNMTLKELGELTGLSIAYLSLVERNKTSITLVSLQNIAKSLGAPVVSFMDSFETYDSYVLREQEQTPFRLNGDGSSIFYSLKTNVPDAEVSMGAMIKVLLPEMGDGGVKFYPTNDEEIPFYSHENEELGYVLEGVLTLYIGCYKYHLYPGDCFHFMSTTPHCLCNYTNKLVKIFYVTLPSISDK